MCDTAAVHLGVEPLIPFGSGDGSRRERFGVKGKQYIRDAVVALLTSLSSIVFCKVDRYSCNGIGRCSLDNA